MREKLDMRQLFADASSFLRTQTPGLLPLLLVGLAIIFSVGFGLRSVAGSPLWGMAIFGVELFVVSSLGVVAYRRGLDLETRKHWLRVASMLFLAQLLVQLFFVIVLILLAMFLSLFAGILIGAAGENLSTSLSTPEDLYALVSTISLPAQLILGLLVAMSLLALVWAAARLILFGVATVAHERLMIFRTWGWTRKHALQILIFAAVFMAPVWLCILYLEYGVSGWPLGGTLAHAGMLISNLLFGHAVAIATYKQLAPDMAQYKAEFS